jgi:outer membrane receptor protein involved in Fe transport
MSRSIRNLSALVCICTALTLVTAVRTPGQTFRGTILGVVTDSSGAAVPGATVTIKNVDTGLTRTVKTTDDGSYSVPELPIGNYSVTVEKSGFKAGVVSGVRVEVSTEKRADVVLQPGQVAQTVEVKGEDLPMVDTTSNTLGGLIDAKVATNLPVNGRDYQKLLFLVPGVTGSPDQITDSPGSFGIFSVNGARGRANNFLLDGTDMNDGYRNDPAINEAGVFGTPATILPVEAIAELHVASNFEAEYGRSAGGVVNVVTKSGTNAFHGSAFDYFRNNALDARNFFNTVGLPQNPFHNNQFGGSLSGPLRKDKLFFFVDYEGTRESGAQATASCVPTANDILFNAPTPGDLTSINPVVANILAQKGWPKPTGTGSCLGNPVDGPPVASGTNTVLSTPFLNDINGGIIKVDYNLNTNNSLTGRYYIGDSTQSFPLALVGGGALPGYNTNTPTRVQLISLSFVSILTPAVVNEARLGWNRFVEGFFPQDGTFDPSSIGLNTGGTGYNLGMPKISVGSFPQLGASAGDPRNRVDSNWHYIDNISWKKGKHDIKFGYEFRRTTVSQNFDANFRGTLKFSSLADFLTGVPSSGSQLAGDTNRNTYENSQAAYVQDTYHLLRNVTLSLGLRYDYFGIVTEKHENFSNVDPTTGMGYAVGPGHLYNPDYNNWAPRVSVAWDVTGKQKTVVRAGYGIFLDAFSQDMFMGHLPFNSTFDPGPAYNGFVGPNLISSTSLFGGALNSSAPVFTGNSPMGDAFGVDPHIRTPYMENYNLNLQQQITRTMSFQIGYVGSQGHKLFRFRDINQPTLSAIQQFDYAGASGFDRTLVDNGSVAGCYCTPRNFSGSPYYYINYLEGSSNSNYNSLQVSYQINNWHGLTSSFNYNWSHSIDDASDGEDYVPNASQPDNSQALIKYNRGNSNFDVRNRFTWNFIYQIPDAKDSRYKLIRNGWGINGILTAQSGQPFHLNYNFEDDYNGSGEGFGRPDIVGPLIYNRSDPNNFLQLSSFAVPCVLSQGTGAGNCQLVVPGTTTICNAIGPNCINSMHFGTLGRNSLIGPSFHQFDLSLYKDTHLTERLVMQLRFEAYNLFNHPNFANPYLPNFIADAAPNGINPNGTSAGALHLTATGDVGIGYPFLGSGGPRGLQIAAKFTF